MIRSKRKNFTLILAWYLLLLRTVNPLEEEISADQAIDALRIWSTGKYTSPNPWSAEDKLKI